MLNEYTILTNEHLPSRIIHALHRHNLYTLADVANLSALELYAMRGIGRTSLQQIMQLVKDSGWTGYPSAGSRQIQKKILPTYFEAVKSGSKTFELRKDDDNIQCGDVLVLSEWTGTAFTGRSVTVVATYVLRNCPEYGLMDGYCIIGIKPYHPDSIGATLNAR